MRKSTKSVYQIALLFVGISAFCLYKEIIYLTLIFVFIGLSLLVSVMISPKSATYIVATFNAATSLVSKLTNPIILGALYICLVTPFAIYWRISGKSRLRLDTGKRSTWSDYGRELTFKSLRNTY